MTDQLACVHRDGPAGMESLKTEINKLNSILEELEEPMRLGRVTLPKISAKAKAKGKAKPA